MNKIPSLFLRDFDGNPKYVTEQYNPDCYWVRDGEGVPTRKYDGTCVMLDDGGKWWARREVKNGKAAPPNYRLVSTDTVTGKMMGWEPIEQSAFARYHAEAIDANNFVINDLVGTYELIGPKVNGNPEGAYKHVLVPHARATVLVGCPRDFDGLSVYLPDHATRFMCEGVVWHHPDGRMAKLKARDFPHYPGGSNERNS